MIFSAKLLTVVVLMLPQQGNPQSRRGTQPDRPARVSKPSPPRPKLALPVGPEFYVSPDGKPDASGTADDPWDLATALKQPVAVIPGSTIWLLSGTYGDSDTGFVSQLKGTADLPIIVRQKPGSRAILNGWLVAGGAYTWYWGFEIMSTHADRTGDQYNPAAGTLDGVDVSGPFTKFINLVVHDTREGFGLWTPAEGAEIYGSIIYNNGWQGPDRGHGHGIYTQNRGSEKRLADNIIFNQFGVGIHGYGSSNAFVQNYSVERNVVFNNGVLARDGAGDNILLGVPTGLSGIKVLNNYTYHTPQANAGTTRIGWTYSLINDDVVVKGNYFIGGYISLEMRNWNSVVFTGNTSYSAQAINAYLQLDATQTANKYKWDNNTYFGAGQFYFMGQRQTWDSWKAVSKLDAASTLTSTAPTGVWTFVNPNEYEPGRGNIVIYNWDKNPEVAVDLSTILTVGKDFEIRDAQNFYGNPLVTGTYSGDPVAIPMTGLTAAQPLGDVPNPARHTAPDFGAFVVVSK